MRFSRRALESKSELWFVALLVLCLMPSLVRAGEPSVVTLLYFRGVGLDNAIRLEWATGTELHTVGFRIERSNTSSGPYVLLDAIGFVPSEGSPDGLSGAEYFAIDSIGTTNGMTYWYRLIEIEGSGAENRSSPISVMAGVAVATPTSTTSPTRTPTSAITIGPTASPGPSTTPVPSRQFGLLPSPTPTMLTDRRLTPIGLADSNGIAQTGLTPPVGNGSSTNESGISVSGLQSTPIGYPGPETISTSQPTLRNGLEGYPESTQDQFIGLPDAYPGLPEGLGSERDVVPQNGTSTTTGASIIGRGNTADSNQDPAQSEQEPASTLMLWLGFLASLVIFVAAVIGSAYIYRRQSSK